LASAYSADGFWQYANGGSASTSDWAYTGNALGNANYHQAEYVVGHFGGGGGGASDNGEGALPVELLSFTGELIGKEVYLDWKTATELDNDFFTLERSNDGVRFDFMARVNGAGNTATPQQYNHIDPRPVDGINYYRLSQTDFDGSTEYVSNIVAVRYGTEDQILVYPNPTSTHINIDLGKGTTTFTDYVIYDALGRIVANAAISEVESDNQLISLEVNHLSPGAYLVKLTDGIHHQTATFVKE